MIKSLKIIITIFYYALIFVAVYFLLFSINLFYPIKGFPHIFVGMGATYKNLLLSNWSYYIVPLMNLVNYLLFIVGVFYLKKCVKFLESNNVFSKDITNNLSKAAYIFSFIGASSILIYLLFIFLIQNIPVQLLSVNNIGNSANFKSAFILIIGLFLLLISKILERANQLKQENDLTI